MLLCSRLRSGKGSSSPSCLCACVRDQELQTNIRIKCKKCFGSVSTCGTSVCIILLVSRVIIILAISVDKCAIILATSVPITVPAVRQLV